MSIVSQPVICYSRLDNPRFLIILAGNSVGGLMPILAAFFLSILMLSSSAKSQTFPDVAVDLEVNEYLGRWYEVASTKPFFQAGCVCVTADYALLEDGNVEVVNTCRKDSVTAIAEPVLGIAATTSNPAKFKVSFGNIPAFFSNYWVVSLAADYSWAVVSSPFRNPIWILSRTPDLDPSILDSIKKDLDQRGFDVEAITPTLQNGCWALAQ